MANPARSARRQPKVSGYYSKDTLQAFMQERGLRLVAVEQLGWTDGEFNGHWAPALPRLSNLAQGPADLWGNISLNLGNARLAPHLDKARTSPEEFARIVDSEDEPERIARSISLSLRNLDRSVQDVAEYYHEELVNGLAAGRTHGRGYASTRDQGLYARVHSFFLHLGSVRDYLATFIAVQLELDPSRTDSMARLVDAIRGDDPAGAKSGPLARLISNGYIAPTGIPSTKWKLAGWLDEATDLRNEFVHRRTYGHKTAEGMGHLVPVDQASGIYRYFRPISWGAESLDIYDLIVWHYGRINGLLYDCARASGQDTAMMTLTDDDLLPVEQPSSDTTKLASDAIIVSRPQL